MDNEPEEIIITAETFREYAGLLWHWAWLLVLCTLLAGGTAYWVSRHQTPIYQASTLVMVDAAPITQTVTYTSLTTSLSLMATFSKLMTTTQLQDGVAERLGFPTFPETASIQVQPIPNTPLMTVIVQDTDPTRAALLANTLVQVFSDQIQADQALRYTDSKKSLEDQLANLEQQIQTTTDELAALDSGNPNQAEHDQLQLALTQNRQSYASVLQSFEQIKLAEAQSSSGIIQQDPAVPPDAPIKAQPVWDAVKAAVVGLMLAAGIVFLIEFLGDTIRDPQEITRKWGVPVLGTIIRYKHDKNELITAKQPRSPITEAFRVLRTNLQFASFNLPIHTLLITSPSPGDGKTTVATNLGSVIAQGGRKVVIVDADLQRPRIHKILQVPNRVGLTDQFIRSLDHVNGAVKQTEIGGLHVLTSGNLLPNPSELLGSERMSEILRQLASQFDTIILDAPPILVVTDALVLAPRVDGVLVVIKPSVTKWAALKHTLEQLRQVKANVIGVVMNDVKIDRSRSYNYQGYYYSQKYAKGYLVTEPSEESEVTGVGGSRKPALLRDKKNTQEEN
ncbi:MAG: polysaccharide biosynthesis tyrosine autokinase [Anaerolineales bacterium]